jgi:ATP-dependent helicase/nuclease subunit A
MLALLQVLDNPKQDVPLAAVLRGPVGRLDQVDLTISGLPASAGSKDNPLKPTDHQQSNHTRVSTPEDALATIRLAYQHENPPLPFHEAVTRYASQKQDDLARALCDRLKTLAAWREMIHQRPVADVLRSIYDDTGLLAWYAGLPDGDQRAANLESLYHRAAQFGTFARQGLARFLRFLENLQRDSDLGQPSLDAESSDVVRIMTIHQSKGLEFPVVFLPNTGRKFNRLDSSGAILADRRSYLALQTVDEPRLIQYPSMATMVVRDTIDAQSTAEEIRILYVALTRAREHLILIGSAGDNAYESARARWTGHAGPLPVATVRDARSMIDWLLPVAAAEGPDVIEVTSHSAEEMLALANGMGDRRSSREALAPLAARQPLAGAAADDPIARQVLERVRFTYPHAAATAAPAARSVTHWTKHGPAATLSPERETSDRSFQAEPALDLPRFLSQDMAVKATDLGTFTHAVLERLAFGESVPPLADQIESMVQAQWLTREQAEKVDQPAIEWFLSSDLGQRIAANADRLRRELPVYFGASTIDLPDEQVMLRGRLDAFLDLPAGGVVIDYKTDRVAGAALDQRAAFYFPQLRAYAGAMTTIAGRTVAESYLVFLQPRQIIRVPAENKDSSQ